VRRHRDAALGRRLDPRRGQRRTRPPGGLSGSGDRQSAPPLAAHRRLDRRAARHARCGRRAPRSRFRRREERRALRRGRPLRRRLSGALGNHQARAQIGTEQRSRARLLVPGPRGGLRVRELAAEPAPDAARAPLRLTPGPDAAAAHRWNPHDRTQRGVRGARPRGRPLRRPPPLQARGARRRDHADRPRQREPHLPERRSDPVGADRRRRSHPGRRLLVRGHPAERGRDRPRRRHRALRDGDRARSSPTPCSVSAASSRARPRSRPSSSRGWSS
jgi:hypothetical protein